MGPLVSKLPTKRLAKRKNRHILEMTLTLLFTRNKASSLELDFFCCTVFVHVHQPLRGKLDPRAIKCLFVGYSTTQNDYNCYDPSSKKNLYLHGCNLC
ncbi:hypothetical protein V2J09_022772 [Rumex salicifolius]